MNYEPRTIAVRLGKLKMYTHVDIFLRDGIQHTGYLGPVDHKSGCVDLYTHPPGSTKTEPGTLVIDGHFIAAFRVKE